MDERDSGSQVQRDSTDATKQAGHARDRETTPPSGQATGASGGYGVGSERSSGGSGETPPPGEDRDRATTADDQTEWLRSAPGGSDDPAEGRRDIPPGSGGQSKP